MTYTVKIKDGDEIMGVKSVVPVKGLQAIQFELEGSVYVYPLEQIEYYSYAAGDKHLNIAL